MKRLGYRKSRKGCLRCKQRRVKCDEKVPCSACSRHQVTCSLEPPNAGPSQLPSQLPRRGHVHVAASGKDLSSASSPLKPSKEPSSTSSITDLFSYFTHFQYDSPGGSDDRAWILDIELIHHYTAKAYGTLRTPCLHGTQVLQIEIPREGLTHPFLLHQILAFSALHLAYLNPDTRHKYLVQASQHQGVAISTMNTMLAKPWVPEACHALYGTSMFVAISAFGTFPSCDRYNAFQPIDSLIDIFILTHGMHFILRSFEENIRKGPLGKLMSGCSCEPASASSYITTIRPRLKDLLAHFEEKMPDISQDKRMSLVEITGTLIESIELAGENQRATSVPEQRVIFGWPMRLPSRYITLLRNKDPLAMVILSYYCVLVHVGEIKCWYFRGWANVLMKSIITIVAGTPWEGLIQWPVEAIKKTKNASDNRTA